MGTRLPTVPKTPATNTGHFRNYRRNWYNNRGRGAELVQMNQKPHFSVEVVDSYYRDMQYQWGPFSNQGMFGDGQPIHDPYGEEDIQFYGTGYYTPPQTKAKVKGPVHPRSVQPGTMPWAPFGGPYLGRTGPASSGYIPPTTGTAPQRPRIPGGLPPGFPWANRPPITLGGGQPSSPFIIFNNQQNNAGGWERLGGALEGILGGLRNTNNIINEVRMFGQTPGERQRDYLDQAFPGTSPWEQLGNQVDERGDEATQTLQQERELQRRQYEQETRMAMGAAIAQYEAKQLELAKGKMDQHDLGISNIIAAFSGQPMANTDTGNENDETVAYRTGEAELSETRQRIENLKAQVARWEAQTSHEERADTIALIAQQIAAGRLELDGEVFEFHKEEAATITFKLKQMQQALDEGDGSIQGVIDSFTTSEGEWWEKLIRAIVMTGLVSGAPGTSGFRLLNR